MGLEMALVSKVITITPDMAKEMLEKNIKTNRRLNHEVVRKYARIMKAGGWNLTHQGIAFDAKGNLIDGQHRLEAIVAANVPITMMVTYGVEHVDGEAFTIDTGAKRTTLNIIQISGINDDVYKLMYGYVSSYLRNKTRGRGAAPDAAEIISYIDRHYDDLKKMCEIMNPQISKNKIHTIVGVALISAFYRGESEDAIRKFCQVYRHNDVTGCDDYNPKHALNLRDWLKGHQGNKDALQRSECAVYSFIHNQFKMTICDRYPYQAALDA